MTENDKYARTLDLKEGWLCLDFANTAGWHASEQPTEYLQTYADLVSWAQTKGVLTPKEGETLLHQAAQRPAEAARLLRGAIDLRETLYRIFTAVIGEESPAPADLLTLNTALCKEASHLQIVAKQAGFVWDWTGVEDAPEALLAPIVHSAVDLLTSGDLSRVGQCADDRGCGWLFFDTSKNHSRRWCSMDDCGNRAKVKLHYNRQRTGK
jgi:predicted RNA-binding Zn ribbon-like protein